MRNSFWAGGYIYLHPYTVLLAKLWKKEPKLVSYTWCRIRNVVAWGPHPQWHAYRVPLMHSWLSWCPKSPSDHIETGIVAKTTTHWTSFAPPPILLPFEIVTILDEGLVVTCHVDIAKVFYTTPLASQIKADAIESTLVNQAPFVTWNLPCLIR